MTRPDDEPAPPAHRCVWKHLSRDERLRRLLEKRLSARDEDDD
ncbi:hypothetical protein [Nocardioides sp.]|nr:hypothetical protein [Nocardioides sp.]MDO9456768.1 hypothetical protein [Nocardioides sp.]